MQYLSKLIGSIEENYDKTSIIITSRVIVSKWNVIIGEKTVADAILDRIIHGAHRLELIGESLGKKHRLSRNNKRYYLYKNKLFF